MTNRVVILAGGENLRYAAGEVPKVLQPFDGKPVIYHSIDTLKEIGFKNENIDILVRDSFGDDIASYIARDYSKINVHHCDFLYPWKDFGPVSKAYALAFRLWDTYHAEHEYGRSSNWENSTILVLNADSVYPKRSLEIITDVANTAFNNKPQNSEQRIAAIVYELNTIAPKKSKVLTFDDSSVRCSHVPCKKFRPYFKIQGKVTSFSIPEDLSTVNSKEEAIYAFRAGDLFRSCSGGGGGFDVPAIDGTSVLDSTLHEIYLRRYESYDLDAEHLCSSVTHLVEELKRSGAKVKDYDFDKIGDDFGKLSKIRNRLIPRFEKRVKQGYLKSSIGTGLTWICNDMLVDQSPLDCIVLGITSNMTYLNLNDIATRDKGKKFLEILRSTDRKDPGASMETEQGILEDIIPVNHYSKGGSDFANSLSDSKAWVLEAIKWGKPVDMKIIVDDFYFNPEENFGDQFNKFLDEYSKNEAQILRSYVLEEHSAELYDILTNFKGVPKKALIDLNGKLKVIAENQKKLNQF